MIDLRSDTVTKPTKSMLSAMAKAELGDDGYKEDPTILRLEEKSAQIIGKEAAIFLPSGTMGNLVAIMTHVQHRKSEIIAEFYSHILNSEAGGYANVAGVAARGIKGRNGAFNLEEVEACIRNGKVLHQPRTALICVENTHNNYGGTVLELDYLKRLQALSEKHGIPMHLDGARIFNGAAALGVTAKELAEPFQSVMFCLSKGLSAPVGSMLAGSKDFIQEARHYRKMLGGGMRQGGVLAAAGIVALEEMVDRLSEDNRRAAVLAKGLAQLPGLKIDLPSVQTNIIRVDTSDTGKSAGEIAVLLKNDCVLCNAIDSNSLRFVTNRHIGDKDVAATIETMERVLKKPSQGVGSDDLVY